MTTALKISIVTPSYNQGTYLEETIDSVLSQHYPQLEYMIVDGGSTDNSVEIIKKYEKHLSWWVSEKDEGQTHAINKGFKRASGDIINWLNSDDVLKPGSLNMIQEGFKSNPQAGFVYGKTECFGEGEKTTLFQHPTDDFPYRYVYDFPYAQPSCFYRRELLNNCGYLNEQLRFSMDYDLFIRLHCYTQSVSLNEVISGFRLHDTSKTNTMEQVMISENLNIFSTYLKSQAYDKGVEVLEKCGAKDMGLEGYAHLPKQFSDDELAYITARFLQRYVFYFYDKGNYTYVYHALHFMKSQASKVFIQNPHYPAMLKKAGIKRFISF